MSFDRAELLMNASVPGHGICQAYCLGDPSKDPNKATSNAPM